jgi:hypothetical protein
LFNHREHKEHRERSKGVKKIIRLFPRRTKATPDSADEVHISVSFSYDLKQAEELAKQWRYVAPVRIGGPATGERSEEFISGMYIKRGYTITSRGCPNKCWFCNVWKREGDTVRTLPIVDGFNVLDDNLLACPEDHIKAVFAMLERQNEKPMFTGGLEAKRLKQWHVDELRRIKTKRMYFAYDTDDDLEPLQIAGEMLKKVGFTLTSKIPSCYVLVGWPQDTMENAEKRLKQTLSAGFTPMAMLYRDKVGKRDLTWSRWARNWARASIVHAMNKQNTEVL